MREDTWQDCLIHWLNSDKNKPFWEELAEKHGYESGEVLRHQFARERNLRGVKSKNSVPQPESDVYEKHDEYINIVCSSRRIKTEEDLIREYNIDTDVWKIEKFIIRTDEAWRKDRKVEWEVDNGITVHGKVEDSGKILLVPLTRIECRLVRKTLENIGLEEISKMLQKKGFSIPFKVRKSYLPSNEVLEINVTDLHFGSDANHSPEKRFEAAIEDIVCRVGKRSFDRIYLAVLGDIFHYDNVNKSTSLGTAVTTNGMKPYEVFDLGLTTMLNCIQRLVSIAPIEVIFVPGNHDPMVGYSMMKAVEAYFKDVDIISVDASHTSRKHRVIGVSLVGWMHGDMPKSRASEWLQVEARDAWGKTRYSEIHAGNYHSQSGKEDGGTILRYLPGMTDIDQWHYEKGYVGAVRAMVSFVWDKEKGLREQWFTIA